jgi:AraC family transcriptional regulator
MTTAAEYQEVALSASATETLHYPNGFQLSFPSVAFPPPPASPLLAIAPGPTRIVRSSMSLSWQGLLLEKHLSSPGERSAASIDMHVISLLAGSPSRFEHRTVSGHFLAHLNRPGTVMITPAGPVPDIRLHTLSEFIHCALDEEFTRGVIEELDRQPPPRPVFRSGIRDKSIQRIVGLLLEELETERPSGRLYVDSLAHALATRYVLLDCATLGRPESRVSGLQPRILNRVREKIEANLDTELSLGSLAEESGYSRAHFLRMFRAATGLTPHQYVLDLRLRRAQDRLRQKGSSIIDVAVSCGFSSQSHMTSVFRQRLEMTPGEFRRNA